MFPVQALRLQEHLHGHLGWLTVAALVHPAVLLRRRDRRADLSVGLALLLATASGALGVILYEPYRDSLRQPIFMHAPALGYLFERKEHLAFGAILLAWAGGFAYAGARQTAGGVHESLRRAAHRAFVAAAALALLTAAFGTIVAAYRTF